MSNLSPKVKTRTKVSRASGTFRIDTLSDFATYGATGSVPDISQAEILDAPDIIDGVSGREGELILSMGENSDAWLDENGNLIVNPDPAIDDAQRYELDAPEGDLLYNQGATPPPQDNTLSVPGDTLVINVNALIQGNVRIQYFEDSFSNLSEGIVIKREFRISRDGIFYTDWMEMTNENLALDEYKSDSLLKIQVRYTRLGPDDGIVASFDSIYFTGVWTAVEFVAPTLMSSVFASLIGTEYLGELEDNLFKKLYFRGIVPQYITRADNVSYDEDRDYIALFYSIARFFSLLIAFFKRFENLGNDEELLREQVRGFGIYFDEGSVTLEDLQYLAANYYSQIQQRGTAMITTRRGETLPSGRTAAVDGELVRLLHSSVYNELLIGTVAVYKMGWCVGAASPLYRGTSRSVTLNKTPENSEDFKSLSNFPIIQSSANVTVGATSDGKNALKLQLNSTGAKAGIGRLNNSGDISSYLIPADPGISYEATFAFRIVSGTQSALNLYFDIEGFDDNKQKLQDGFIALDGAFSNGHIIEHGCGIWKTGVWYFARGIIHAYGANPVSGIKTNLGVGCDLIFNNPFLRYIYPRIMFESGGGSAQVEIWDFKIRPLVWGKSILPGRDNAVAQSNSMGFVQVGGFMYTYARNNNNSKSQEEITDIIEKYLYPYGKVNMFVLTGV